MSRLGMDLGRKEAQNLAIDAVGIVNRFFDCSESGSSMSLG